MPQKNTIDILEKYIGRDNISIIDKQKGIYKCHKYFKNSPYQILYVDCSNKWTDESFNLKELESYQEEIFMKDYYDASGPLQWNFYYAFISSTQAIHDHKEKKEEIEKDEMYARKLVLSNDELNLWLSRINTLSKPSATLVEKDLSSVWVNKLKNAELDVVFGDEKYTTGVDKYLEGEPIIVLTEAESNDNSDTKTDVSFIDQLEIKNYRKHPLQKKFNFGKVNLIKGLNGCGKTSLLEAIELILCGKTYRNDKTDTSNIKITAKFSGSNELVHFLPGNHKIYKDRDNIWYNNADQRTNRLHVSFNKFNFYNTDAASTLSNDSENSDIKRAFEDIALGQEVNRIEQRLNGFHDRFSNSLKNYNKLIQEYNYSINKENALITDLGTLDKSPEIFLKELLKEIKNISWNLKEAKFNTKAIVILEKRIITALSLIESISEGLSWHTAASYNAIIKVTKNYTDNLNEIVAIDKQINSSTKKLETVESDIENISELLNDLKNAEKYFNEQKLAQLKNLENKIEDKKSLISRLKKIKQHSSDIHFENVKPDQLNLTIKGLEDKTSNNIKSKEEQIKTLTHRKEKLSISFSQLEKLISEIKTKGREYIKLNSSATECPLCYSSFPEEKLAIRIKESRDNLISSGIYDNISTEISNLNRELKTEQSLYSLIEKIKKVAYIIDPNKGYNKIITVIKKDIASSISILNKEITNYNELLELKDYFDNKELYEEEYLDFISELDSWDLKIKDKKQFDKANTQYKNQAIENKITKQALVTSIKKLESRKNEIFSTLKIIGRNPKVMLEKRIESLIDSKATFEQLAQFIELDNDEKILTYEKKIKNFQALLLRYKKILKEKEEFDSRIEAANSSIKDLNKKIKSTTKYQIRAQRACKVIEDILKENSKASFLKNFIDKNKDEIAEIFKVIHSPKEFEYINFGSDGSVNLKRIDEEKEASLSEISTGQRSALALSIFSALNRKLKRGPNILLFDDPVANIDDLNVLSYFDYLREVAVNGNRQIFFATANENVAFLFSQKFNFLGEDYKEFNFAR